MNIRFQVDSRAVIAGRLLRALPEWFGIESAIEQYLRDVEAMPMLVAYDDSDAVGFVALNAHNEWTMEIHVMAIHPDHHRRGVGRALLEAAEAHARKLNTKYLTVKTLSPSRENREYAQTRQFYFAMGFRPVEEFKTLWGEGNPCLLMLKVL